MSLHPIEIRPYDSTDAQPLADLYVRSVEQIGSKHYSALQVEAWASSAPTAEQIQKLGTDGRTTLVAVDRSKRPIAYGDLEPDGHIDFLYCAPEAAGRNVASALYDALEALAREQGVTSLYAEASEAARRFFEKKGFLVRRKREFEVSGVAMHNYAVEKRL